MKEGADQRQAAWPHLDTRPSTASRESQRWGALETTSLLTLPSRHLGFLGQGQIVVVFENARGSGTAPTTITAGEVNSQLKGSKLWN